MNKSEEPGSELKKTSGNTSELFQLVEKAFNEVPLFVLKPIAKPGVGLIGLGRNAEVSIVICNILAQIILSVSLVCHDNSAIQIYVLKDILSND